MIRLTTTCSVTGDELQSGMKILFFYSLKLFSFFTLGVLHQSKRIAKGAPSRESAPKTFRYYFPLLITLQRLSFRS